MCVLVHSLAAVGRDAPGVRKRAEPGFLANVSPWFYFFYFFFFFLVPYGRLSSMDKSITEKAKMRAFSAQGTRPVRRFSVFYSARIGASRLQSSLGSSFTKKGIFQKQELQVSCVCRRTLGVAAVLRYWRAYFFFVYLLQRTTKTKQKSTADKEVTTKGPYTRDDPEEEYTGLPLLALGICCGQVLRSRQPTFCLNLSLWLACWVTCFGLCFSVCVCAGACRCSFVFFLVFAYFSYSSNSAA